MLSLFAALLLLFGLSAPASAQAGAPTPELSVPEAPQPQEAQLRARVKAPTEGACQLKRGGTATLQAGVAGAVASNPSNPTLSPSLQPAACPPLAPLINWYSRFLNGPEVKPLSPKEKARLTLRNLVDPFNLITIAGNSAIAVGANSHSAYGPGMAGFGRNVGVSFTQDMTAEFFGTFAIPSLVHQDPHYHRMPQASLVRRVTHAIYQVVWTQGDNGKGMVNYSSLVGFAIDGAISNLYVPGQHTDLAASVSRYGIGLATAPIENFIIEFLPDVARRIHIRVVLVQRIINQVARTDSGQ